LERIDTHVVASQIAPHQNGTVAIMIPHIRFSDRPLRSWRQRQRTLAKRAERGGRLQRRAAVRAVARL